jgi:pimeloyl-ACP methyl ester carboxylesterase
MRRHPIAFALLLPGVAAFALAPKSATPAPPPEPPPTIAPLVDKQISAIEKLVVEAAEAMPEEKFNFSPEGLNIPGSDYKGVRTFAVQVRHVAASNYVLWAALTGDVLPEDWKGGNGPEALRTKAEILKFLKDSFALGHRAAATLTIENMLQTPEHSTSSRLHRATFAVEHAFDHYGQMVEYLRMNGIVPPASRGKSDAAAEEQTPSPRVVDLKAPDGTMLKASYYAAAKPGPGVLLLHQINRDRQSWDELAARLAAAGIHTLTLDLRGFGESGGAPYAQMTPKDRSELRARTWAGDIDTAWQFLVSQPWVDGKVVGIGGAGGEGVDDAVQTARRHPEQVKSMVLISGETLLPGMQFIRQASQLPGLYVVAEDDEYPPTVEAMEWLYLSSSNPGRKLVYYPGQRPPWLGFEDVRGVPARGTHGTDMFKTHPDLPGTIVDWYVTTLIRTPGHAPADPLACAPVLLQVQAGEIASVAQQLAESRRDDPQAQLFPEISVTLMGYDQMRVGNTKLGVETMKLNVTAYPNSADANDSLSDTYLADGQKELARKHAEKALALLASDIADSEVRRTEIRESAEAKLKQLGVR